MSSWNKWLFGGLGWALGGPIGGIIGFALGSVTEEAGKTYKPETRPSVLPNDFSAALMVLCAAVMKADQRLMRSELDYVKAFFTRTFGEAHTRERMAFFREILKQEIQIAAVCQQVRANIDHSSRLELLHLLFGLAGSDGEVSHEELTVLERIATLIGISGKDFISIRAMFVRDANADYKILEIDPTATVDEVKKAYRKMAMKYHPDKVHHLGPEYQKDAQEKFRKINEAYEAIKKQRGFQ
jgi:DnaJ like chaperone protein